MTPFTGLRLPYVFFNECIEALDVMFRRDPVWNFQYIAKDRDYAQLSKPWSVVRSSTLAVMVVAVV